MLTPKYAWVETDLSRGVMMTVYVHVLILDVVSE